MRTSLRYAPLVLATLALVGSFTGVGQAARRALRGANGPGAVVRLDRHGRIPAKLLPRRVNAARLGGAPPSSFRGGCPEDTTEFDRWCVMNATVELERADIGKNDFAWAAQYCAHLGGYVPSASQLIGVADRIRLASTLDDSALNAAIDEDPSDGLKDRREMTSTLVTVAAGSSAAGSTGVTQGSTGDPRVGEPDPIPQSADPFPSTLQYVTVFDNGDKGGFGGSKPVSQTERFRCAFEKTETHTGSQSSSLHGGLR